VIVGTTPAAAPATAAVATAAVATAAVATAAVATAAVAAAAEAPAFAGRSGRQCGHQYHAVHGLHTSQAVKSVQRGREPGASAGSISGRRAPPGLKSWGRC